MFAGHTTAEGFSTLRQIVIKAADRMGLNIRILDYFDPVQVISLGAALSAATTGEKCNRIPGIPIPHDELQQ